MPSQQARKRWFFRKGRDSEPKIEPLEEPPRVFRMKSGGASFSSFFSSDKRPVSYLLVNWHVGAHMIVAIRGVQSLRGAKVHTWRS